MTLKSSQQKFCSEENVPFTAVAIPIAEAEVKGNLAHACWEEKVAADNYHSVVKVVEPQGGGGSSMPLVLCHCRLMA